MNLLVTEIQFRAGAATALQPFQSVQYFKAYPHYWDGAADQEDTVQAGVVYQDSVAGQPGFYWAGPVFRMDLNYAGALYPNNDNTGSIGKAGATWGDIFATLPTSDPGVAGQLYTTDAAGLAAELAAGSRYVLVSDGP